MGSVRIRLEMLLSGKRQWYNSWKHQFETYNPDRITPKDLPIIPKTIHQIWLGSPYPEKYKPLQESFKRLHPDWEYKLWTDNEVAQLTLHNQQAYDTTKNFGQKADIARYEILYQFGGFYADVDYECLKPLDIFHHSYAFYAAINNEPRGVIGGSLQGAVPNHPVHKYCLDNLTLRTNKTYHWREIVEETGPDFFTQAVMAHFNPDDPTMILFPCSYFLPLPVREEASSIDEKKKYIKPESYTIHYWDGSWK